MAFIYDYAANPMEGYEDEETRRRRLEQQRQMAVQTPAAQVETVPTQPVVPRPIETVPDAAYTAQQESGGRFDIGRHGANTTATGAYGITAPAFQDVQRSDPYFAGKTLETLTPEEQTRAYSVVRQNNAGYLQKFGVEPNDANLRLAHFLGAKGAADYIKEGRVSDAAAKFNGGEQNVRRIADARLAGQPSPSSGAVQPVAPVAPVAPVTAPAAQNQFNLAQGLPTQPGLRAPGVQPGMAPQPDVTRQSINFYQQAQDNPQELLKLRADESAPEWMRRRAADRAFELMNQEVQQRKAQEQVQDLVARSSQGDARAAKDMSRLLQQQEGSWAKYILLGFISPDLAKEEAIKLGFGNVDRAVRDADGNAYMVTFNAKGTPLRGYNADGVELDQKQLVNIGAMAAPKKAAEMPSVHGAPVVKDGVGGLRMYDPVAQESYVLVGKKRLPDVGWTSQGQAPAAVFGAAAAGAAGKGAGEGFTPTPIPQYPGQQGAAPQAAPQAAPMGQPAAPAAPMSKAQQAAQQARPVAPGQVPTAPVVQPAPTIAQQRQALETQGLQQKEFVKYVAEDMQPKADAGSQIKRIRKEQMEGPDGILNNPELAGLLSGTGGAGAEVANIVRDLIAGNFKDQTDLSQRIAALNLTPRQKEVLYRQIGLNFQVAPLTLKQNAGPGAVSDAEQKANREANVDITRMPLYSSLSLLTRDQFQKDLAVAKNDFRSSRPDIRTTDQLNQAWREEKRKAEAAYDQIYAARAAYIAKHNPNGTNPGAIVDAFKYYPVPEWTGTGWDYRTDYARRAARPKLDNFVR